MKLKTFLRALVLTLFCLTSGFAIAAPSLTSLQAYKNQLPQKESKRMMASQAPRTYATVIGISNKSPESIYISAPGSRYTQLEIRPGDAYYFASDDYFDAVFFKVWDESNLLIFDDYLQNGDTLMIAEGAYPLTMSAKSATKSKLKATVKHK